MLKFIWKLIKIVFVALIIFGLFSMIVSLIVTFSLSAKMATDMSKGLSADQELGKQVGILVASQVQKKLTLSAEICRKPFCDFYIGI